MLVKELIGELQKMNPNYDVHMLITEGPADIESEIKSVIKDEYRRDGVLLISPTYD